MIKPSEERRIIITPRRAIPQYQWVTQCLNCDINVFRVWWWTKPINRSEFQVRGDSFPIPVSLYSLSFAMSHVKFDEEGGSDEFGMDGGIKVQLLTNQLYLSPYSNLRILLHRVTSKSHSSKSPPRSQHLNFTCTAACALWLQWCPCKDCHCRSLRL